MRNIFKARKETNHGSIKAILDDVFGRYNEAIDDCFKGELDILNKQKEVFTRMMENSDKYTPELIEDVKQHLKEINTRLTEIDSLKMTYKVVIN